MASAARLRDALRVHSRLRIFRWTNTMNAMTTHARWRTVVVFVEQRPAVRAILELGQLIGWQRRVELVHNFRVGMAASAKLNNPSAIFLAIFLRPFLDKIVAKIGRGITAVTTGA